MRFEELCLRIPGNEVTVKFHDRLTVFSGIGAAERSALVASLLDAVAGRSPETSLVYVDAIGRRVRAGVDDGRPHWVADDGSDVRPLPAVLGDDLRRIRRLMVLRAADVGLPDANGTVEPQALAEARAALASVTDELQSVLAARQAVEAMRSELCRLDEDARRPGTDPTSLDDIRRRRAALAASYSLARTLVPDADRLLDRHRSLERRVERLEEAQLATEQDMPVQQLAEVSHRLIGRLTEAIQAGPDRDPVPVVLDDPFRVVPVERKWDVLDLVGRLAERIQLVYLTDDPYVGAWARRRQTHGGAAHLEPITSVF